jgi:hypothetical protein
VAPSSEYFARFTLRKSTGGGTASKTSQSRS